MNGGSITPTVELATTNGGNGFVYPYPYVYGNNGNSGFFGGDGIWALVLLALLFNGNNGFGGFGGNGYNNLATTEYISSEFTQRDINNGFQNQSNLISNGFSDNATNICNLRSEVLENRYANQLAECNTQRDILMQTTAIEGQISNLALSNQAALDRCCCELRAEGLANTQRVLDKLCQQEIDQKNDIISALRSQVNMQNLAASQTAQTNDLISTLRPCPIPAYLSCSPYQSYNFNPYGNGCGCNGNGNFI